MGDSGILQALECGLDDAFGNLRPIQALPWNGVTASPRGLGSQLAFGARDGHGKQQHQCEDGPVVRRENADALFSETIRDAVVVTGCISCSRLDENTPGGRQHPSDDLPESRFGQRPVGGGRHGPAVRLKGAERGEHIGLPLLRQGVQPGGHAGSPASRGRPTYRSRRCRTSASPHPARAGPSRIRDSPSSDTRNPQARSRLIADFQCV
jgi:hypothetical protein